MKNSNNSKAKAWFDNAKKKMLCMTAMAGVFSMSPMLEAQNTFPATGNVGIGTTAPGYPLDVQSSNYYIARFRNKGGGADGTALFDLQNSAGTTWRLGVGGTGNGLGITAGQLYFERSGLGSVFTLNTNGYLGLGLNPSYKLHVTSADIRAFQIEGNNASWTGMYAVNNTTTGQPFYGYTSNNGSYSSWHYLTPTGDWRLNNAGDRITVLRTGQVGIGTTAPSTSYLLSVNGSIRAKEVVVETGWADFVFDKDYKLKSLSEVESYINTNKHLPDVPSATEVQNNGVNLGAIQTTLLQKIEELTLYTIEANKQIEALKAKVADLESSVKE